KRTHPQVRASPTASASSSTPRLRVLRVLRGSKSNARPCSPRFVPACASGWYEGDMLKRIELTNFKSFAHGTFDVGPLTVFVGANAAGKSNVRDALRIMHGVGLGYSCAEILGGKYGPGGALQW